jgi:hypothetical protein
MEVSRQPSKMPGVLGSILSWYAFDQEYATLSVYSLLTAEMQRAAVI